MLSVICRNRSILRPHRFLTVTLALIFLALSQRAGSAAVTLIEFKADTVDSATNRVSWRTGSEIGTVGFIVWRGGSFDGPWQRLGTLPAEGDSISGASYGFDDGNLASPAQAWYKLQELANQGNVCFGPVAPGQGSRIDSTPCPSDATATTAPTATSTATPQPSATPSPTLRASPTLTATPLPSATPSATQPPTNTPTPTTRPAALITPSSTPVIGPTRSPTATLISVILVTATPSATLRVSPTLSSTPTAQATHPEPTPAQTAAPAATPSPTPTEPATSTPSATPVYSPTPWTSPTPVFPAASTPPANPTPTAGFILLPSPTPFPDRSTSSLPTVFLLVGLGSLGGAAALGFVAWRNYRQKPPTEGP